MGKVTFSGKWGRVRRTTGTASGPSGKSAADVVRAIKEEASSPAGRDYREQSLRIHGLICAKCGREFEENRRHLLTVHHKDGNHFHNPPDGSNWENLCVYCHEDAHSREILGDYLAGTPGPAPREQTVVYRSEAEKADTDTGQGILAEKLRKALADRKPS